MLLYLKGWRTRTSAASRPAGYYIGCKESRTRKKCFRQAQRADRHNADAKTFNSLEEEEEDERQHKLCFAPRRRRHNLKWSFQRPRGSRLDHKLTMKNIFIENANFIRTDPSVIQKVSCCIVELDITTSEILKGSLPSLLTRRAEKPPSNQGGSTKTRDKSIFYAGKKSTSARRKHEERKKTNNNSKLKSSNQISTSHLYEFLERAYFVFLFIFNNISVM